jgi:tetratricopeptide (TPR) repeat protein
LRQRGNLNDAYPILSATLAVQQKLLGEDAPATLDTMHSLAMALEAQDKLEESVQMNRRAVALWSKRGESETPRALYTLESLAATLEKQGKWPEAEQAYREVVSAWRRRGDSENPHLLYEVEKLSRILVTQKKFGDAEALLDEVLTPAAMKQPSSANLLAARGGLKARRAHWQEAATDLGLPIELNPADTARFGPLAALLAKTQNQAAYDKFCQQILATYSTTTNTFIADQVAKACLLLPSAKVDLNAVNSLADTAVALGASDEGAIPFFTVCKALAEYRQGHYTEAAEWAHKSLAMPREDAHAHAYAVLAMAEWRLAQVDLAREALAKGELLAPKHLPPSLSDSPDDDWIGWLFARVSLDEASGLIKGNN